jgi:hypothetical protein
VDRVSNRNVGINLQILTWLPALENFIECAKCRPTLRKVCVSLNPLSLVANSWLQIPCGQVVGFDGRACCASNPPPPRSFARTVLLLLVCSTCSLLRHAINTVVRNLTQFVRCVESENVYRPAICMARDLPEYVLVLHFLWTYRTRGCVAAYRDQHNWRI